MNRLPGEGIAAAAGALWHTVVSARRGCQAPMRGSGDGLGLDVDHAPEVVADGDDQEPVLVLGLADVAQLAGQGHGLGPAEDLLSTRLRTR